MLTHKHIDKICVCITILAVIILILFVNGEKFGIEPLVDEDAESYEGTRYITENDLDFSWDTEGATHVYLDNELSSIDGDGAYLYEDKIVIASAGKYIVSGDVTNSSIVVDAASSAKIWIQFAGVNITNEEKPCIKVKKADKVFLTLANDSENYLTSNKGEGAINSKEDITINGNGMLEIISSEKHGINVNDSLVIAGATVKIEAAEDAIHADGDIAFVNCIVDINAKDDAVSSKKDVNIENANLNIADCYEGIEAGHINVYSGNIQIYSRDDGFNARVSGKEPSKSIDKTAATDTEFKASIEAMKDCSINIEGGNITIVNDTASDADGFDSNGDILISGGNIFISLVNNGVNNAIDYGSEVGGICKITGGTVIACGNYVMAEGFDKTSTQPSFLYSFKNGAMANSYIAIKNSADEELFSGSIPCSFNCITFSSPNLQVGEEYQLVINDKEATFVITDMAASYGEVQSSRFGGDMNWGPKPDRPENGERPDDKDRRDDKHGPAHGKKYGEVYFEEDMKNDN